MKKYLDTATSALQQSRLIIKQYFRQPFTVEDKSDASPVTIADKTAEETIRQIILSNHPEHGILGEEHGIVNPESPYQWVIDPIDGTKSFISGSPIFGTLLSLTHQDVHIMGIIDMPILDERWIGLSGENTLFNNKIIKVSNVQQLEKAKLYNTEPDMFNAQQLEYFNAIKNKAPFVRFGGDCYSYGLLASGHIDLVVDGSLKYYDIASLIPVIQGAGGFITDWRGNPLSKNLDGLVVAAATKELHQAALGILSKALG